MKMIVPYKMIVDDEACLKEIGVSSNSNKVTSTTSDKQASFVSYSQSIAKYQPTIGTDTLTEGAQPISVNTKTHCITAMKEYEAKSLEELRMEYYLANRKWPQAATDTGFFDATRQPSSGLFGQTAAGASENIGFAAVPSFGANFQPNTAFGAEQAFGFVAVPTFGATSQPNTAFQNFSLNNRNVGGGGLFNGNLNKPQTSLFGAFGTNTSAVAPLNFNTCIGQSSLFGNTASKPDDMFGTFLGATNTTGEGLFGQAKQSSLFGQPETSTSSFTAFGQTAPTTRSIFSQPINSATQSFKYQPTIEPDILGQSDRMHCITAMQEFKEKSLEELRMEYYLKNRKILSTRFGFTEFGDTSSVGGKKTDLFNAALFGQPMEEATINNELFSLLGYLAFGQPVTSEQSFFGTTNKTGFAPKPAFGQTTAPSMFGQTTAVSTEGLSVRIEETLDRNLQSEKKVLLSRTYIFK